MAGLRNDPPRGLFVLLEPFAHFDPRSGELPDELEPLFQPAVERGRALIPAHRTREQIEHQVKILNRLLTRAEDALLTRMRRGAISDMHRDRWTTPVDMLGQLVASETLDSEDGAPGLSWSELLATFSLACAGEAVAAYRQSNSRNSEKPKKNSISISQSINNCASLAIEAAGRAEYLQRHSPEQLEKRIEKEIADRISKRNRQNANERYATPNRIKAEFIVFWLTEAWTISRDKVSRDEAAKWYAERLKSQDRKPRGWTKPARVLRDALRDWEHGRLSLEELRSS